MLEQDPLYGFEQEYTMMTKQGTVYGWPNVRVLQSAARRTRATAGCASSLVLHGEPLQAVDGVPVPIPTSVHAVLG